jgi:hypothetical protein
MATETAFETTFKRLETEFVRRWKRPSRGFVWVVSVAVVGLFVAVGLPNIILPKFSDRPTTLNFRVRVIDDQGIPVMNANVFVGAASGQTDVDGHCELAQDYLAKGTKGLSGTCRLEGDMRVEAPGFIGWRRSLNDLFGRHYDYVGYGTNLVREVILFR